MAPEDEPDPGAASGGIPSAGGLLKAPGAGVGHRRGRYGLLLGAIIVVFAVQGVSSPDAAEQVFVSALLGVTLLLALWAAEARSIVIRVAVVIVLRRDRR